MIWKVGTTSWFGDWFATLRDDEQVEIIAKIELLKVMGPQLSRPHAGPLNGSKHANMKELRADTKVSVIRIAFAFDPERSAILLVGGNKTGVNQKRFYKQLIAKADELYSLHILKMRSRKKKKGI